MLGKVIGVVTQKKSESSVASTNPSASSVISNQSEHKLNLVKFNFSSPVINGSFKLDLIRDIISQNEKIGKVICNNEKIGKVICNFEKTSLSKDIGECFSHITKSNHIKIITIPEEMQKQQQEDELHRFASLENISSDDVNELESLLKKGLNPNVKDEKDNTPLHKAVSVMIKISDELSNIISNGIKGDKAPLVLKQQCRLSRSCVYY